jgi:hypothetical protein
MGCFAPRRKRLFRRVKRINRNDSSAERVESNFHVWSQAPCSRSLPVRSTVWVGMKMLRAANFGHPRQWRERWTSALRHRQFEEEAERYTELRRRCVGAVSASIFSPCGHASAHGATERLRPDFGSNYEPVGLWQPDRRRIIIKRSELRSVATFAGALLHEMTHASTGLLDVTRDFERALTTTLGNVSAAALDSTKE